MQQHLKPHSPTNKKSSSDDEDFNIVIADCYLEYIQKRSHVAPWSAFICESDDSPYQEHEWKEASKEETSCLIFQVHKCTHDVHHFDDRHHSHEQVYRPFEATTGRIEVIISDRHTYFKYCNERKYRDRG